MAASSVGWVVMVGGTVVLVEAVRHLASARAAVSAPAGSGGAGSTGSTAPASASGGASGMTAGGSGGQPTGGVATNVPPPSGVVNVGGGPLPGGIVGGSWVNEAAAWANGQSGAIAPGGSAQGLANAIRALVIGESNGYPEALGDNGQSHGLLQLYAGAFGATATDPTVYRSLTNSLNVPGVGDRILATYNRFASQGLNPLSSAEVFGRFWAQAQGADPAGTQALAPRVLQTFAGAFPAQTGVAVF